MLKVDNSWFTGPDDFLITVISNHSMDYFPNNSSAEFKNMLYRPKKLPLDEFEVGITDIFYQLDPFRSTNETQDDQVQEKHFGYSQGDNLLRIEKRYVNEYKTRKRSERLADWFKELQQFFDINRSAVQITFDTFFTDTGEGPYTVLTVEDKRKHYHAEILPQFAEVLGFEGQLSFNVGKHVSKQVQDEEKFKKIPISEQFVLKLTLLETPAVAVQEPEEYNNAPELIENCFEAIKSLKYKVTMPLDLQNNLRVSIQEENLRFRLPKAVNQRLGLADDFVFSEQVTTVPVPKDPPAKETGGWFGTLRNLLPTATIEEKGPEAAKPAEPVKQTEPIKATIGPSIIVPQTTDIPAYVQISVCSDIVEPGFYGCITRRELGTFLHDTSISTMRHVKFNPVYHKALSTANLSSIEILLVDENFEKIPVSDTPTKITLQFRRKR